MKKMIALLAVMAVMTVCAQAQVTDEVEKELGFQPLFNGENLEGWINASDYYEVKDGCIWSKPKGGGHLFTAERYPNFIFRFDFQLTPNANNGVGIHVELEGDPSFIDGQEIQILDDSGSDYTKLQPYQYHGSIYGVVPAKRGSLKPVGEWNTQEIICDGTRVKVTVNGEVIVDVKVDEIKEFLETGEYMDHRAHPGLLKNDGHIGFLGHATVVAFRNLRVLPLTSYGQGEKTLTQEKELREAE